MPKLTINQRCSATEVCNDVVGLSCQDGSCKCGASSFWKDSKCSNNFNCKNYIFLFGKYKNLSFKTKQTKWIKNAQATMNAIKIKTLSVKREYVNVKI